MMSPKKIVGQMAEAAVEAAGTVVGAVAGAVTSVAMSTGEAVVEHMMQPSQAEMEAMMAMAESMNTGPQPIAMDTDDTNLERLEPVDESAQPQVNVAQT
jgi:hypothetical protein